MTSAGTLPAEPRCRLSDAQVLVAQVVGVNPAFNLALLKVQGTNLPPIRCAEKPPPVAGTILAAVGMSETPLAIGVVSVPRRDMPGPFPTRVARRGAERPGVFGKPTAQGYLVDSVQLGKAYEAGIRIGDVILTIAGRDIRDEEDLLKCVSGRVEGERVPVGLLRGGQRQDLILSLVAEPKPLAGFPTLFEHDMPLTPDVCGGPVVDLAGELVGITLYCGEYGCMAIPGDCVKPLLLVLKSSGLSDQWIKPPPASPTGPRTIRSGRETSKANESTNSMNWAPIRKFGDNRRRDVRKVGSPIWRKSLFDVQNTADPIAIFTVCACTYHHSPSTHARCPQVHQPPLCCVPQHKLCCTELPRN